MGLGTLSCPALTPFRGSWSQVNHLAQPLPDGLRWVSAEVGTVPLTAGLGRNRNVSKGLMEMGVEKQRGSDVWPRRVCLIRHG